MIVANFLTVAFPDLKAYFALIVVMKADIVIAAKYLTVALISLTKALPGIN